VRTFRGCLALVMLAWGTLGFSQEATCPYYSTKPEVEVPVWMQAIARRRSSMVKVPHGYVYNWRVPLRWGGATSPDNVIIIPGEALKLKLTVESFLGNCVCSGSTLLATAVEDVKVWERWSQGVAPFNPSGACPVEP
jgi:hypothetical protein